MKMFDVLGQLRKTLTLSTHIYMFHARNDLTHVGFKECHTLSWHVISKRFTIVFTEDQSLFFNSEILFI